MKTLRRRVAVLFALVPVVAALSGCAGNDADLPPGKVRDSLPLLRDWMTGSFDSSAQAARDPDYFNITLQMIPVWPHRQDGPWLYVEQARADAPDKPYRQRVYRLSKTGERKYRSDVYTLPEPADRFVGAWREPAGGAAFSALSPSDLSLKSGCSIHLTWHFCKQGFTGSTDGPNCESNLRGASYATSEVELGEGVLRSWDRGFDAAGKQVWGAEKGGYEFIRRSGN